VGNADIPHLKEKEKLERQEAVPDSEVEDQVAHLGKEQNLHKKRLFFFYPNSSD
jgi:hypothetical protein